MTVEKRIEQELGETRQRLRRAVADAADEIVTPPDASHADPLDEMRVSVDREIAFATRSLLVDRAQRLAAALDRVRNGSYGVCDECGGTIPSARLRALPEVATCVACQHRLELRAARPAPLSGVAGGLQ
jgi:DnaK suppressor protein